MTRYIIWLLITIIRSIDRKVLQLFIQANSLLVRHFCTLNVIQTKKWNREIKNIKWWYFYGISWTNRNWNSSLTWYLYVSSVVSHDACIKQKMCATENFPICFRKIVPPAPKIKTKMKNDSHRVNSYLADLPSWMRREFIIGRSVFNATPLIELLNRVGEMPFVVSIDVLWNEYP